jgi:hypothetical protein
VDTSVATLEPAGAVLLGDSTCNCELQSGVAGDALSHCIIPAFYTREIITNHIDFCVFWTFELQPCGRMQLKDAHLVDCSQNYLDPHLVG